MILAGDEAQVQFATIGVRPHLSGPRGSLASLRAVSLSYTPDPVGDRRPIPPANDGASTFVPPVSGGHALVTPTRVSLMSIRI
jgi:hypothetical protein